MAAVAASFAVVALVHAQSPPGAPTFAYVYGRVLLGGENLIPDTQPVIAFVNGKACGGTPTNTLVASEGDDVKPEDVGRTVYVIDVLADGTNTYERLGCGRPGDPILLYFPAAGRTSSVQPLFQSGPLRADLELDIALSQRAGIPQLAADGAN
ncbi:MAG: hypothetical protein WD557_08850 [Dehalococcoidia bacterium]